MNSKLHTQPRIKIAPSILSADFGKLNKEIATIDQQTDLLHVDIMDGHFVPNVTFGPSVVARIKSKVPLDCHLMIEHPENFIDQFAESIKISQKENAKNCFIDLHVESKGFSPSLLAHIKKLGLKAAVALRPATPLSTIEPFLGQLDMVLLMTVNPGFGGQAFIENVLPKIKKLRAKMPLLDIQVDGGINNKTAPKAIKAGANILVAGSYIFHAQNRQKAIESLYPTG